MSVQDGWKLCPRCGGALTRVEDGALGCDDCDSRYYANAAPTASALVVDEAGRVLLARRARDPDRDKWDVPGGFLDEREAPEDAVRRELREESGLDIELDRLLGAWTDVYGDDTGAQATLNLVWIAHVTGGAMAPADDVAELRWFARDELPQPADCAFRCVAQMLSAWRDEQA